MMIPATTVGLDPHTEVSPTGISRQDTTPLVKVPQAEEPIRHQAPVPFHRPRVRPQVMPIVKPPERPPAVEDYLHLLQRTRMTTWTLPTPMTR